MFFNGWDGIIRTIIVGVLTYVLLLVMLRVSGKRTLSKLNAFDLVVTVALGSILATVLLSKDVALFEGMTAFAVLIILQYIVAAWSVRSATVRKIVKSTPKLLFYEGLFIDDALLRERITQEEIYAAIRAQGIAKLNNAKAVVLETDGSLTVLKRTQNVTPSTLKYVAHDLADESIPHA